MILSRNQPVGLERRNDLLTAELCFLLKLGRVPGGLEINDVRFKGDCG